MDTYITTTLMRDNVEELEVQEKKRAPTSNTLQVPSFQPRQLSKELVLPDTSGKTIDISSWNYNVMAVGQPPSSSNTLSYLIFSAILLPMLAIDVFDQYPFIDTLGLDREKLKNYLDEIAAGYFDNPLVSIFHKY